MLEKTFDAAAVEPRLYEAWEQAGAFKAGAGKKDGQDSFCIVIPPPNVTGSLHMGHALNNTLQDVMIRYYRMKGRDVLWQPGMDHAGIATQMVVERQLAANNEPSRRDMGREKFIDRVWEWKAESGGTIFNQLRRLGATADWSRERFTMDEGLSKAVQKVFIELYNEGLIYRGKRLVNWDPKFETAISDLEVENTEVDGHMWHFKYPLAGGETYTYVEKDEDGNVIFEEERDYISIATTRPETMLGDGAVAVHPSDERYAPILGKLCEIPVGPKEHRRLIPIITDEYPDPDFGSGAVKITGAHDFNDYQVARRNKIPLYRLMDEKAALRADGAPYEFCAKEAVKLAKTGELPDEAFVDSINLVPDEYRGLDRFEARKKIVEAINEEGLCVFTKDDEGNEIPFVESKKIMQPFGDRSGVVIEPMLTDQWFADAKTLAKPAIASVKEGRTNFVPKNWEKTYFEWMENIEPWCISRQLWWGHQIPAWYGPEESVFVAYDEAEAKAQAKEKFGKDVELTRDEDVLDTWFSSALWPFSTLGWPDKTPELESYYQTDVLVTGFDIIFFWVARMMMMSMHFMKKEPFHTVYVHALVRDEHGAKMSKSKGNVIDPLDLVDEYGADAVRFTLTAMAAQGRDIKLATSRVAGYRNFGTKLWNATRFTQMNGCARSEGFDPTAVKETVNQWIVTELSKTADEVSDAIETYRFNDAANTLYRFVWNLYCDWYIELSKPVLQTEEDSAAKTETQACAAWVLDQICLLLHPIMPYITEELWAETGKSGPQRNSLLALEDWPSYSIPDTGAADEINWMVDFISAVRSIRSEMNITPSTQLKLEIVGASDETKARLAAQDAVIKRLARCEDIKVSDTVPQGSAQVVVGEATVCLPLAGVIDLAAEKARLEKELDKIAKVAAKFEAKLGNEKFLANAPEEIVAEQKAKLQEQNALKAKVQEALDRILAAS
ncbi:valyl-tRNA synthetase [Cohaesibacter sp. ES.047]|uniref:valine--tRNA ligase n=1 Tax=Cohaesibacter sp. ES.047 TaxID=1798205 RepID=UPI000BB96C70|nr:valine--tRNA ligase [Cohaesibacter sp. ES.047]SNY93291.1 valyl-tRNA synthetase [Cohaesibacter sp. ES.047]